MHAVPSPEQAADHARKLRVKRLVELFTDNHGADCEHRAGEWHCDPYWGLHGLSWWFPRVVEWIGIRSSGGRRGAGGSLAVPIDLSALDFVSGKYWVDELPPTEATVDDEDNYRAGFILTVLGLEQSVRVALGLGPQPRARAEGYDGLAPDSRVPAAVEWIAEHAGMVVDADLHHLEETLREEALRLLSRAAGTLFGSKFEATRNPCRYCYKPDSVIADEDRAVCVTPYCRNADGTRRCWRLVDVNAELPDATPAYVWVEVPEPDRPVRVTDDAILRWADAV